ncbi:hypothetical protein GGF46_002279 [Coemansia sp. RSA 552]|nr:hypothetical protein GGF46_002279 [Coemansia sp. RSA 552]
MAADDKQKRAQALVDALAHGRKQQPDAAPPLRRAEGSRLASVLLAACALRLCILVLFPGAAAHYLSGRVELATPVTSHKRLVEGLHLSAHGISPYDGGLFHQSPLLLLAFAPLRLLPDIFTSVIYVGADALVALLLAKIAAARALQSTAVPGEMSYVCSPATVALLYLFNPLTLATTLARSTIVFSHLAIVAALYFAVYRRSVPAAACTAVAAHLSLYPAMLVVPVSLIAAGPSRAPAAAVAVAAKTVAIAVALHAIFATLYGGEYFRQTIQFTLRVSDLQPNVGLFWYFFIEIFDEFRSFFIVVFQLTALAFAAPISWRFRHEPLFAAAMLVGITSALKSYPAWGDLSLFLALIPLFEGLAKYLQYAFLSTTLLFFGIGLAPVFWHLWIEQGSGNANFFYAATLVYVFGQIVLLFDLGSAMLRRELDIHRPDTRTRAVIQE